MSNEDTFGRRKSRGQNRHCGPEQQDRYGGEQHAKRTALQKNTIACAPESLLTVPLADLHQSCDRNGVEYARQIKDHHRDERVHDEIGVKLARQAEKGRDQNLPEQADQLLHN